MLKDYLRHIGNSLFFMYQEPFSHDWDTHLTRLMDEGEVISADRYRLTFFLHDQHYAVWVGNRWYSYGHLYEVNGQSAPREFQYRPRFSTMCRAGLISCIGTIKSINSKEKSWGRNSMKRHQLKILPEHFATVVSGEKKAEFRINDRDYAAGDLLCLSEYGWLKDCDGLEGFSGQFIWVRITHVTDLHPWKPGYVMLSIERGPFKS